MIFIDQFFFFKENRENEIKLLQKIINTQLEVTPKEAETQLADTTSPTTPQRTPSVEGATVVNHVSQLLIMYCIVITRCQSWQKEVKSSKTSRKTEHKVCKYSETIINHYIYNSQVPSTVNWQFEPVHPHPEREKQRKTSIIRFSYDSCKTINVWILWWDKL